jgi:N-acetylneuraminic acid mutarotase
MRKIGWIPFVLLLALTFSPDAAGADTDAVRQIQAGKRSRYLSSNGNGGSIYVGHIEVDIRVKNLCYEKVVGIRWTADDWATHVDTYAAYKEDLGGGFERWNCAMETGNYCLNAIVGRDSGGNVLRGDIGAYRIQYIIFFKANGKTYWDTENGAAYVLDHSDPNVAANSPGAGAANPPKGDPSDPPPPPPADLASTGEVRHMKGGTWSDYLSSNGNGGSIYMGHIWVDIRAKDLCYGKVVGIRWTADDWKTHKDTVAEYKEKLDGGYERWNCSLETGTYCLNAMVGSSPTGRGNIGAHRIRYAVFFQAGGRRYWDSNSGFDYTLDFAEPRLPALPEERRYPHPVLVGGDLYVFGGQDPRSYHFTRDQVLKLNPSHGNRSQIAWERVSSLPPIAVQGGPSTSPQIWLGYSVAALGDKVYLMGGHRMKVGGFLSANLCFDTAAGSWTQYADLPVGMSAHVAVVRGKKIYLVGGRSYGGHCDDYVYDTENDAWSKLPPASGGPGGVEYEHVTADGFLYCLGGLDHAGYGAQELGEIWGLDVEGRQWTKLADPPYTLRSRGLKTAALDGRICIYNADPDPNGTSPILIYDALTDSWTRVEKGRLLSYDASLAAGLDGQLCIFSGGTQVDRYDPDGNFYVAGRARTVVRIHYDAGWGNRLALRGDQHPLSWGKGVACRWTPGNIWEWETTDLDGRFTFQVFFNDQKGMQDGARPGRAGRIIDIYPRF